MSEMNCPHCKAAFESSERLLQHFADSPACFQRTASLAGADGGPGKQPLALSAINPQANQLSAGTVTRRTLLFSGTIVVAVAMALSAVVAATVAAWINARGVTREAAQTQVAVQPARSPHNLQVVSVSNSTASPVPPMQSAQVFTSAPPASVANATTGTVSQNAGSVTNVSLKLSASRSRIQLGESFNLMVEVNGADRGVDKPLLSALPQSAVQYVGRHSNSRRSISIINGRMFRTTFDGCVFAYTLTPKSQGEFHTGPVCATVSGKTYTHPGVTVAVAVVP